MVYQFLFKCNLVRHQVDSDGRLNESINWKRLSVCLVFFFPLHCIIIYSTVWFSFLFGKLPQLKLKWLIYDPYQSPFDPEVYHHLPSMMWMFETRIKLMIPLKMDLKMCCLKTLWNISREYQVQFSSKMKSFASAIHLFRYASITFLVNRTLNSFYLE